MYNIIFIKANRKEKLSMNKWRYPNKSDYWDEQVDYVMFVDENNSVSSLNVVMKKMFTQEEINPNENIFTVTGCIFKREDYYSAKNKFDELRNKYWKDGKYLNPKTESEEYVCFHTEDIKNRKKAFHKNCITEEKFNEFILELDRLLNEFKYKIISINIDIEQYLKKSRYSEMNIYKIAFNFIIERLIYYMSENNTGSIVFEARGKKEDNDLLMHIDNIINKRGTEYISTQELSQKIEGVYFNKKRNGQGYPYVGLEIADLSSYPIHRYIKFETKGKDFETIKSKIIGYPNCIGKGLKIYPTKK